VWKYWQCCDCTSHAFCVGHVTCVFFTVFLSCVFLSYCPVNSFLCLFCYHVYWWNKALFIQYCLYYLEMFCIIFVISHVEVGLKDVLFLKEYGQYFLASCDPHGLRDCTNFAQLNNNIHLICYKYLMVQPKLRY